MSKVAAIVLAAGSGSRFGEAKQFADLTPGRRLVDVAIDTVMKVSDQVVLVLPPGFRWDGRDVEATVEGGRTRLESVAEALAILPRDSDVVVIHDAAHPLASQSTVEEVVAAVHSGADGAVPTLLVTDVIKRQDESGRISTLGRDGLGLAQVPMAFATESLRAAHAKITDKRAVWEDSELVERNGGTIVAVPGSTRNVHIVTDEDLEIARRLASKDWSAGSRG